MMTPLGRTRGLVTSRPAGTVPPSSTLGTEDGAGGPARLKSPFRATGRREREVVVHSHQKAPEPGRGGGRSGGFARSGTRIRDAAAVHGSGTHSDGKGQGCGSIPPTRPTVRGEGQGESIRILGLSR